VLALERGAAYLINPGSVGQPRDGDRRAAYLVYDAGDRTVEYRRVEYDIARAQAKIRAAWLPELLAERLEVGN
jgi:diadenosine tetraphosphatase ApaH/serine/threonine PP2A family protein phosphatase